MDLLKLILGIFDFFTEIFDFFRRPVTSRYRRMTSQVFDTGQYNAISPSVNTLPKNVSERLNASRDGKSPWMATLSPAELLIIRSYGIRPITTVSATCWMYYGWSWSLGHAKGWNTALQRLREEAIAAGANAVIDVKMRTIPLEIESSMDFSLVGTAVKIDGLPPSTAPIVSTVSALEFVKLLEADIVPTGIAIGAAYEWVNDSGGVTNLFGLGNIECMALTDLWKRVRTMANTNLRKNTKIQGNGALAHINFNQMLAHKAPKESTRYLARTIVIATTVDTPLQTVIPHDFQMVIDMHTGKTPLAGPPQEYQPHTSGEADGYF